MWVHGSVCFETVVGRDVGQTSRQSVRDATEAELIVQCVLAFIFMALSLCCLTGLY